MDTDSECFAEDEITSRFSNLANWWRKKSTEHWRGCRETESGLAIDSTPVAFESTQVCRSAKQKIILDAVIKSDCRKNRIFLAVDGRWMSWIVDKPNNRGVTMLPIEQRSDWRLAGSSQMKRPVVRLHYFSRGGPDRCWAIKIENWRYT